MGERVCAVKNDETVKQVVVVLHSECHGRPVRRIHGGGIQQRVELEDSVANMATIRRWGSPQARDRDLLLVEDGWDGDLGCGHVVERRTGSHGVVHEALAWLETVRAVLHAYCASSSDDEDTGFREAGVGVCSGDEVCRG